MMEDGTKSSDHVAKKKKKRSTKQADNESEEEQKEVEPPKKKKLVRNSSIAIQKSDPSLVEGDSELDLEEKTPIKKIPISTKAQKQLEKAKKKLND